MIFSKDFHTKNLKYIYLLALLSCIGVLAGRGWQHLFWDPPYRTFLWDEKLLKPAIENLFGLKWEEYVTSVSIDHNMQNTFQVIGIFLMAGIFFSLFMNKFTKWAERYLIFCSVWLLFLSVIYWKEYFWDLPQFVELTAQWTSPLILVLIYHSFTRRINILIILRIILAMTFFGHGLYALGWVPLPGNWVDLVINTFSFSETNAKIFLKIVGAGDILAAFMVFYPKTEKAGLLYMFIWGSCAALGRITGSYYQEIGFINFIHQQLGEFLIRLPQFLLPAMTLLILKEKSGLERN